MVKSRWVEAWPWAVREDGDPVISSAIIYIPLLFGEKVYEAATSIMDILNVQNLTQPDFR